MNAVSKNIKKLRLLKRLTQEDMADRLFVTRQTVSNWETGKSQPDIDTLIKIAETFHTDTSVLIYGFSDSRDMKKEKKRLIISAAALLVFGAALFFLNQYAQNELHAYYNNSPLMLSRMLFQPIFWLWLGWAVIQGLDFWGVIKPIKAKPRKVVRIATLAIVLFYTALMIPFLIGMIDCWIQLSVYRQTAQFYAESSFSYEWTYPIALISDVFWPVFDIVLKQPIIFVIPGLVYRLFKPGKQKTDAIVE